MIRKAHKGDLEGVVGLYDRVFTCEEAGRSSVGWIRGVYPTKETALTALRDGTLYVLEDEGELRATARIDNCQMPQYSRAQWSCEAEGDEVLVLHTLVVDPAFAGKGYGSSLVAFYEAMGREKGCRCLRMDTNEINSVARSLYNKLGFRETGIIPCTFHGIEGVGLVCLEKLL